MAKRESQTLKFRIRQRDGSFEDVSLTLHPPNGRIISQLTAEDIWTKLQESKESIIPRAMHVAGVLIGRFDPEHNEEWLLENLEEEDISRLWRAALSMCVPDEKPGKEGESPNAVSP